ncbi:hypothetical protein Dsin_014356 [Dipteronia sinensis]|uniref:RRM domain-containing protein n=1 Tax=Dipteronia sinensis TaxID=43782 RepID=A0AAE0E9V5_9ROSI|nr:hypothetical protein Dsin_014356 [Dipteronia sinensis]
MRRETVSERSSHLFGVGKRRETEGAGLPGRFHNTGRKDYRDNMVSIFIDNLNPKVDVACLWGVFKVFGRVRDVFLSTQKRNRKSLFAFIRFESVEEAKMVAKKVDGMHVYGWPISAKLAEYGWQNRKISATRRIVAKPESDGMSSEEQVGRSSKGGFRNYRSFAEVLKRSQENPKGRTAETKKKCISVYYKKQQSTENWLSRCTIGVLKDFSSVSSVNSTVAQKWEMLNSMLAAASAEILGEQLHVQRRTVLRNMTSLNLLLLLLESPESSAAKVKEAVHASSGYKHCKVFDRSSDMFDKSTK